MLSAKEIFIRLFPQEQISNETAGYLYSDIKLKNILLGNFPYKWTFEIQPAKKCEVIVGEKHILIDMRIVTKVNLKIFLLLIPFAILLNIIYLIVTNNFLTFIISFFIALPIPLGLIYFWLTSIQGGGTSYLFNKEWIREYQSDPIFFIKGTVPQGQPYYLSQYLAMNNITIPDIILSGSAAWIGSEYPWKFVETDFNISISKEMRSSNTLTIIIFLIGFLIMWLSIHLTYIILPLQLQLYNSALTL
ncbi:hypothetical protein COV53_03980 [Candidatus Gottesmanbacteria bacterium CG11_big_fil_rev_8_21_14_0_20_37_11]|uniref:Uncharacterized protein n=3 Tax=Candidatus Gottesmaniibacteriota TaxID=1752720 RepID=A0A2M7RRT3_9BACT|nr:MAG: hypothetical protein AUJ73_00440 [Candidatus Gottesmanbacteria bacterium CG1_02_37_22]PIR08230.1 MAG: hypothetical protein COV53_03980 [Candidatus Gottesmanbacteria bacterium CG11_big_fil_rev_8_21_14_0_20_37_11]PIZ02684.1 MAG: hypothetical protein COY59_03370 [Candidatus Gottesmanbacteria bacterium CG_4_10_14_0_8_um_filter_37_24]